MAAVFRSRLPSDLNDDIKEELLNLLDNGKGQNSLFATLTTASDWLQLLTELGKFKEEGLDVPAYLADGYRLLCDSKNGNTGIEGESVTQPWGTWYDLESWGLEYARSPYSASTTDTVELGSVVDIANESPRGFDSHEQLSTVPATPAGLSMLNSDEQVGTLELGRTAFVIVAGGLGERLGFSDIKVNLQVEQTTFTTYIKFFFDWLRAIPTPLNIPPYLVVMTSDDTHSRTLESLAEITNCNFHPSVLAHFAKYNVDPNPFTDTDGKVDAYNIRVVKQSAVPCFSSPEGLLCVTKINDRVKIETKPHGHGDIHSLIYKNKLCKEMLLLGLKHILFWQDTNALFVHAAAALVGHAINNNLAMNFLAIPRVPQEALGALCLIAKNDRQVIYQSVEYNLLGDLLKLHGGEASQLRPSHNTPTAYSIYPGNTNIFRINIDTYMTVLEKSQGKVPDFVNPKYTDKTKNAFASPARLECMMQDISILISMLNTGPSETWTHRIGYLELPRWQCFSPIKNNITTAANKFAHKIPTESAASAEFDFYLSNLRLLEMALTLVPSQFRLVKHQGIMSTPYPQNIPRNRLDSADSNHAEWNPEQSKNPSFVYSLSSFGILDHFSVKVDHVVVPYFCRVIFEPSFAYDTVTLTKKIGQNTEFILQYGATLHIAGNVVFEDNAKVHIAGYVSLVAKPGGKISIKNLVTNNTLYHYPIQDHKNSLIRGYIWAPYDAPEQMSTMDNHFRKFIELQSCNSNLQVLSDPFVVNTDQHIVIDNAHP